MQPHPHSMIALVLAATIITGAMIPAAINHDRNTR